MDPLWEFIHDLEAFLKSRGYEIASSEDIDLRDPKSGTLLGFWPSTINAETFKDLT